MPPGVDRAELPRHPRLGNLEIAGEDAIGGVAEIARAPAAEAGAVLKFLQKVSGPAKCAFFAGPRMVAVAVGRPPGRGYLRGAAELPE